MREEENKYLVSDTEISKNSMLNVGAGDDQTVLEVQPKVINESQWKELDYYKIFKENFLDKELEVGEQIRIEDGKSIFI